MTDTHAHPYNLASYACDPAQSKGRLHPEIESDTRSAYQRDRDRIIHSTAFRRLEYKTQVFINHEGDHYRTRLTHSLEVSQLARSTCRMLGLNEDLAEALALAHDLGHTPFGHAGEDALSAAMEPYGGFDHNAHTIRILTSLEQRYAEFDGLNLTWETLEGTAKHNGPLEKPNPSSIFNFFKNFNVKKTVSKPKSKEETYGGPPSASDASVPVKASRSVHGDMSAFEQNKEQKVPRAIAEYNEKHDLELSGYASAEAQVASLCDDIAYNNHDIDDGLRARLFTLDQLEEVEVVARIIRDVRDTYPDLSEQRLVHETIRRIIHSMAVDVIAQTKENVEAHSIETLGDIRRLGKPVVGFSPEMYEVNKQLKAFLHKNMYRHYKVNRMASKARRVVAELFEFFMDNPDCLPTGWREQAGPAGSTKTAQLVNDFIAGMTDRFALDEHQRIFDVQSRSWLGR